MDTTVLIVVALLFWLFMTQKRVEHLTSRGPVVTTSRSIAPYNPNPVTVVKCPPCPQCLLPVAAKAPFDHLTKANVDQGTQVMTSYIVSQGKTLKDLVGTFDDPITIASVFKRLDATQKYYVATALINRLKVTVPYYVGSPQQFTSYIAPQLSVLQYATGLKSPSGQALDVSQYVTDIIAPLFK